MSATSGGSTTGCTSEGSEKPRDPSFDRLTSAGALWRAEERVRQNIVNNDGTLPPRADLPALSDRLRARQNVRRDARYAPNDEGRVIAHLRYEDRIVDRAVATELRRIAEHHLPGSVHGFRPKRGQHSLIAALRLLVARALGGHVVRVDIKGFFDNVPHATVTDGLRRIGASRGVLGLVESFLAKHAAQRNPGEAKGMPQGSPLSPVLANICLLPLMQALEHRVATAGGPAGAKEEGLG